MRPGRAMRQGSVGLRSALVAFAFLMTAFAPARGADVTVENLRVGFVSNTANNLFKIGTWTPVWVQLKGGSERFAGDLEIEVPDDEGTPTFFRLKIDVAAGETQRVVTYARPGTRDPNFVLRLYDQDGRRRGRDIDGSQLAQLSPLGAEESLILTLGKPQGVDQVPALPGFSSDKSISGQEVTVARAEVGTGVNASLPGRWYGFDAAASIVVDTNDKDLMEALAVRGQALVDWVARGGHVIVAVNANWQSVRDSVLGPILPALPNGQVRLNSLDLKTLDVFAAATKSISTPDAPPVLVTKLEDVEKRGGKILSAAADVPLVVRGSYGFGRVTLVALDVDQKPFTEWPDRAQFWVRAVDLRRQNGNLASANLPGAGRTMYQSGVSDLVTQLKNALEQFPGVRLIPFGWVAFFIFLYILLIGPGDYFFLKKVVKRMELTWITFPVIVVTVSLAAYYAAYLVKGRELIVNKVDVVDVDQASGMARGTSFVNLFSPQNRDYDIAFTPRTLAQFGEQSTPADPKDKTAGAALLVARGSEPPRLPPSTDVLVSWQGVPESGFGGMGQTGRISFAGGGYRSLPTGFSTALEGVRIPIWSTKLLSSRWYGPSSKMAESDLIPVGVDRLSGTVTNTLAVAMNDTILAFGKHVYQLGTISPGETITVELKPDRQLSPFLKSRMESLSPNNTGTGGQIARADLMLGIMFHDSQSTTGTERTLASNPLHYLDLTGQLALDRPMLVSRVDAPAATLILGNAPGTPKVEQTTMLRVILPLRKPPGA